MRIMFLHSAYALRGGEDESAEAEAELIRSHGHEVRLCIMRNAEASSTGVFWSREAARHAAKLINAFEPDVVHLQNTHFAWSPSVIMAARRARVPVVMAVRNYRLACPSAVLSRPGKPQLCEECVGRRLKWPAVAHSCYHGRLGSLAMTNASLLHRAAGVWGHVDRFIAVSKYVRRVLIDEGFAPGQISVKPNVVWPEPGIGRGPVDEEPFVLFCGGTSDAKKGWPIVRETWHHTDLPRLVVAGDAERGMIDPYVSCVGRQSHDRLLDLMGRASVVIVPSVWPEPFGRVAIEALAKGTPIVVSGVGGLGDILPQTISAAGVMVAPGDPHALAGGIRTALAIGTRQAARDLYETRFSAEANYQRLIAIYDDVCAPCLKELGEEIIAWLARIERKRRDRLAGGR